jgi:hypothetical protein
VSSRTPRAERVIVGRVATLAGDSGWGWQSALAIAGGRVLAVGDESKVGALASPATKWTRLPSDAVLLPGITDAHLHLMALVVAESQLDLTGMDLRGALAAIADAHTERLARGDSDGWLLGHGWSVHALGGWPDADMLESVAPGRLVALYAHDHHSRWVSHAAIRVAGIDAARGDAAGSLVRRGSSGRPSGILHEASAGLVDNSIPDPTRDELEVGLRSVAARLFALGVTGCHDPGELDDNRKIKRGPLIYRDLAEEGRLPLRVHGSIRDPQLDRALELGLRSGDGVGRYTTGWLKLFVDGSLGSRSAALLAPYDDAATNSPTGGPTGMVVTDAEELRDLLFRASGGGIVGEVHAIGDAAVRIALDVLAETPRVDSVLRPRIEHAQLVDPADQPRFGALGIAASVQPVHLRSDAEQQRLGWGRRSENTFPLRTFIETGALIPFGTDAPVEPPDPWPGIAVAVARRDPFDLSALPTRVDQAISVERAIRAACLDPGLVAGRADLGRLLAGYVADLIVVPDVVARDNPDIEELASIRPLVTMIDGEVVLGDL